MLTLMRKIGEEIIIGDNIRVLVKKVGGAQVKLAIDAPRDVTVHRSEVEVEDEIAADAARNLKEQTP